MGGCETWDHGGNPYRHRKEALVGDRRSDNLGTMMLQSSNVLASGGDVHKGPTSLLWRCYKYFPIPAGI
jgi:hypothetical protein